MPADGRFGSSLSTVSLCYLTFQYNQRLVSHHTCECSSFEAVEVLLLLESNIEPPHSGSVKALLSYGGGVIDSKLECQDSPLSMDVRTPTYIVKINIISCGCVVNNC